MTRSLNHHPIVLKLPDPAPALVLRGRYIVLSMTESPWFASLLPLLNGVSADLDHLQASQATSLSRTQGSASARDVDQKAVVDGLKGLAGEVQKIVDQNVGEAATIAATAGMYLKGSSARSKPELAASMGKAPGQVVVRARALKGAAYEWQMSTDGGVTWVSLGITTVANTSVLGLARGTACLFRFRTTRGKVTGDWSAPAGFFVY